MCWFLPRFFVTFVLKLCSLELEIQVQKTQAGVTYITSVCLVCR